MAIRYVVTRPAYAAMFEPDFLNANHLCVRRFIEEIGAADAFFEGQTGVALDRGIPIQWCFATPMLLMWTLQVRGSILRRTLLSAQYTGMFIVVNDPTSQAPAVTNFRVSYDYYYGVSWDIGRSSLLVWAMGSAPSKDTFWTSDNGNESTTRGACDKTCPPDHSAAAAVLHTMLAVLSAGPVGFSDAPNYTDAVLIKRTCDADGNLLQPSKPLTAIDSTHDVTPGGAPSGYVLTTHTQVGGATVLRLLVSHQLTTAYSLRLLDLWPLPASGSVHVVGDWATLLACASLPPASRGACGVALITVPSDVHAVVATIPAPRTGTDPFTPFLHFVAPACPTATGASGVALLGEIEKFAAISVQRFIAVACSADGSTAFTISGIPGEVVGLAWFANGATFFGNVTLSSSTSGRAHAVCTANVAGTLHCA